MSGVTIFTSKDYIFIKIPKKQVSKGALRLEAGLSQDEALKLFRQGTQEFKQGKLKQVKDLSQLV